MQYYPSEHCIFRTRYSQIIKQAQAALPASQIYVGIYENMFTEPEVLRLSRFLQIEPKLDFANVNVNKTVGETPVTAHDAAIREFYAEEYEYCFENFSVTQQLWA